MKTRVFNILVLLVGIAGIFGYKLDLTPEQLSTLAGIVVAIAAAVNQVLHEVKAPPPAPEASPPAVKP